VGARILGVAQIGPGLFLGAWEVGAAAAARTVVDAALLEPGRRRLDIGRPKLDSTAGSTMATVMQVTAIKAAAGKMTRFLTIAP
jgi:hypothetical protein